MTVSEREKIIKLFKEKPVYLDMGAGKLAKRFKVEKGDIYDLKKYVREDNKNIYDNFPKILILDIETAPIKAYVWKIWKTNVYTDQLLSDWYCLTWAAKWLNSDKMLSDKLTPEEVKNENDLRLVKGIWKLIDEADIVIAHNAKRFDIPKLNTRFIINNLQPPSNYKIIDTLVEIKKIFAFTRNSMDSVNKDLGLTRKIQNSGMELWVKCLEGDENALTEMCDYNEGDIIALQDLYLKIRPWIKSHPNIGIYQENIFVCSSCGSSNIKPTYKFIYTHTGKYPTYKCEHCGAESRSRQSHLNKTISKNLLISVPGR